MLIGGIILHIKLEHERYRGLLKCDEEVGSGWINVKYFPRAVSHCYAMDAGIIVPVVSYCQPPVPHCVCDSNFS